MNGRLSLGADESVTCSQSSTAEFDYATKGVWHYPARSERSYQLDIVRKALLRNTMVVLPTGLGKTFIACVVMYNVHRWYPRSKVIFLAPTKPLVLQQAEAFHALFPNVDERLTICEMTGSMCPSDRISEYASEERRIFFMTPQVLANDMKEVGGLASSVKCIVFDEAHRAIGNYAYVTVVKQLLAMAPHNQFRVLALSATPGADRSSVQQVIDNLLIAHIELRTEESIDVAPYMQQKMVSAVSAAKR